MNDQQNSIPVTEERVGLGVLGAFLFSLAGGVLYVLLSMIGFYAAITGFVAAAGAILGYSLFAKRKSKRGVIISVIMAAVVLILAWYVSFCIDMLAVYELYYEAGDIQYVPTFFEYLPYSIYDLQINPMYFLNLLLSLVFAAIGSWRYIAQALQDGKRADTPDFAPQTTPDAPGETFTYSVNDPSPEETTAPVEPSPVEPAREATEPTEAETDSTDL